ncbi:PAS domain-containing sensor histidine kinase [Massilia sp. Dwa41.01b]|uniref:PAS domain-containing sensor histidine kinase n=1 Tax=unclassified Massilia TaxID=2609279 RepID=UPI0016009E77|nr:MULTISPECIES: PAS domain-containing sensor histidine kinase [unclassified Massilia]QNA90203.1 PAS domain-containing sensor histidine kinase [Massilia sp. Dwa41.01b]QNB01091.1 PAS domain-containing sensor histidine kinase [Massilia sp. Se16.2.3]
MSTGSTTHWTDDQAAAFSTLMLRETRQHGVLFYDDDLRITGWNAGAHLITGWCAAELIGQSIGMLFVPEDRERKLHEHEANTTRTVGVAENERWHIRKDGSRFWSSGISVPMALEDGTSGFVKVFRDATHLRARMKYLENVLQEHAVQRHENNVFIGTIAHEMRNPLSPLKTALELMKRLPDEDTRYAQPIRIMDRQVNFLERLVEDLVDLTRVQAGKMNMRYEWVRLQDCVQEAIDSCRQAALLKGMKLHQVLPSVAIDIEVDPRRLLQVVVNLLNNAIKYTPQGGDIWVSANADQTHFLCYVKDNGQGIAPDLLPRIFEVFTQADNTRAERGTGLGIGLAVVREIVALHQGTIEVRSEGIGKGSEFIVRIPLHQPHGSESEPLPAPGEAVPVPPHP